MAKVNEKWLIEHGWKKTVDETTVIEKLRSYTTTRHGRVYDFRPYDHIWARIDHITTTSKCNKDGSIQGRSNYYMFYAYNEVTHFRVEQRISHRRYEDYQIEAALQVIDAE